MKITRLILATFILCGCNDEHLSPVDKLCHENGYQHHYWTQSGLLVCENRGYSYPNMTHEIKLARDNCRAHSNLARRINSDSTGFSISTKKHRSIDRCFFFLMISTQIAFRIKRCCTTRSCGAYCLTINMIRDVSTGIDSFNGRFR